MTDLQILILSLVQGITEFLPISSSVHLLTFSKVLGWPDQGLELDVAMHMGTLIAVVIYLFGDVWNMVYGGVDILRGRDSKHRDLAWILIIATIPTVCAGYFFKDSIATKFREVNMLAFIAWISIIFGFLLWWVDKIAPRRRRIEDMSKLDALLLGLLQVLALIPGVSRSGICMTGGRLLGLQRTENARISMLMGIPILFAAGTLIGVELYQNKNAILTIQSLLAVLLACCASMLSIRFMMFWFKKSTMAPFAIYRILFGCALLYMYYTL